ncbi:hypothetical protein [Acidithiobacillus ferriphilus]|uniref:hypothetical protein n=1 Tax=Acidithiobacillus ferriphilus TaxID=1689834 RepID=UPI002DBC4C14|nr:hypothetical protein [Acidithiobacillus ferriphilus]MEB8489315.1 hypothetical protein [Acidithiobacillus ferriphilus]
MSFKTWFVKRSPLPEMWREHMAEYYAPKNFNIWAPRKTFPFRLYMIKYNQLNIMGYAG